VITKIPDEVIDLGEAEMEGEYVLNDAARALPFRVVPRRRRHP